MNPDFLALFESIRAEVESQSWFAKGWTLQSVVQPNQSWFGIQLSKSHWFNETGNGIHFETWLNQEVLEEGVLHFQAHILHAGMVFPGTDKKASALSRPLINRHRELIDSWDYIIPISPGMTLFSTRRATTRDGMVECIVRECSRFAELGDAIDELLVLLLEGKKVPSIRGPRRPKMELSEGRSILPKLEIPGPQNHSWEYKVNEPNAITPVFEDPQTLRIEVSGKAPHGYDRALICHGMTFEKGRYYRVHLEAKAASEHRISGCILQSDKPNLPVTIFPGLTIKETWQTFTWDFVASLSETQASLHFSLGRKPNTTWFRKLSLVELV